VELGAERVADLLAAGREAEMDSLGVAFEALVGAR
jgi:hypothetical protein